VTATRFYENVHFIVGAVAAGLAVAAGGTAFAGETTIAGVAAVLSAVLTGFLTVHRPEERYASHWRTARDYSRLYDDLTLHFGIGWRDDGPSGSPEGSLSKARPESSQEPSAAPRKEAPRSNKQAVERFMRRQEEIEEGSFPVPNRLCHRAESQIADHESWVPSAGKDFAEWRDELWGGRWERRLLFFWRRTDGTDDGNRRADRSDAASE
jgi:hypothetical protein